MSFLGELYKSHFEKVFENHPNKDEIIPKLVAGDNSTEQVDAWFQEANQHNWEALNKAAQKNVTDGGFVKFERYED